MIYIILGLAIMMTTGILLANHELATNKRKRREAFSQRARRCVRREG